MKPLDRIEQVKLFLALSRTPHGLLDMATPAFAVLLYLGGFPAFHVVVIGLITAFAGYTAVYALNDIVDYRSDKEKGTDSIPSGESYLDSVMIRHPMAQGLLSYREGLAWTVGWALVALIGAYILNPMCVIIFLGGALLETIYCLLWRVSPWRSVISGFVKNSGPVAALYAVDPNPSGFFMIVLFIGLFSWEIGGQNIPADWTDLDLDRHHQAKTIPVKLGEQRSAALALMALTVSAVLLSFLFWWSSSSWNWIASLVAAAISIYLLLMPAIKLYAKQERDQAMALFNRASYYPLVLMLLALAGIR
jgi:4-hydroxybenzoate polyprenyltransferase